MRILRNTIIAFILTFLAIAAMMMIPSPQPAAVKPWDVKIMPDGNVEVLGIHLGTTNYQQAQEKLGIYGDSALFTDPNGKMTVEAFFDSVNLGGFSSKLVLTLGIPETELEQIEQRATSSMLQPSMARKHELSQHDKEAILAAPVTNLTYIPSVRLSEEILLQRFGEPASKQPLSNEENAISWQYPELNMEARLKPKHKTVLLFNQN